MRAMTEIEWLDGRVTKVPELAMGEPPDLDRVFCILYEGQPRVCRVAGELGVTVSAVNTAAAWESAWESGMGAGSETPVERPRWAGTIRDITHCAVT